MANFAKDDLVDCIRYNIALMDESGLTAKIIIPPRRRLPAESCQIGESNIGGNNLGQQYLREEGEGSFSSLFHQLDRASSSSSGQEQNQQKNKPPIRDQIRTRLLAKLHEMEQNGKVNKANQPVAQRPTECILKFVPKINLMKENDGKPISMTSRLIAEIPLEEDSEIFAEFAKFEAMEGTTGSKRFTILFPFAEQPRCAIQIQIVRTAKIADLIGLACHIYSREQHNPPCSHPNDYDLYLAEEDLEEFDTELPPQDRRRRVADCGFPTLAMVKKASVNRRPSQRILNHQIKIFLVDGRCYTMETESLDISMRQVLEYGLDRKKEDEKDEEEGNNNIIGQMNFFRKLDYVLEPFDQPGVCLDLNSSVSSTGTTDFVLLRMNSARGEILAQRQFGQIGSRHLQTRSLEFSQLNLDMPSGGLSKPSTPISGNEFDWKKHRNRFSLRQSQAKHLQLPASIETMATLGRRTGAELAQMLLDKTLQNGGILLDEFQVNRIHRFQPKTPTRLIMRERCLELIPIQLADHSPTTEEPNNKKKRGMAKNAAKCKKVPWELIAAVEVPPSSEQRQNARRIVRIISLSGISPSLIQHIIDTGKGGRPPSTEGNSAYESSYWKIFLVEAAADEAWQIGVRLSEMLDLRPSQVHTLYNYSAGATLKPFSAAEKAFCAPKSLPKSSAGHSPGNSTSISGEQQQTIGGGVDKAPKKKLSMIFSRMRL